MKKFNTSRTQVEESSSVIYRDLITLALMGIVFVLIIILPFINPSKKREEGEIKIPGEMIIEMIWDKNRDIDMDLWVQAPDEPPVGFSNKKSLTVNLLRDDLGSVADISGLNYEHTFVRTLKEGRYVINAHSYRWDGRKEPLKVKFIVTVRNEMGGKKARLVRYLIFENQGEEKTALSFSVTKDGNIDFESIDKDYVPLLKSVKNTNQPPVDF